MNSGSNRRVPILELTILVMVGVIVWAAVNVIRADQAAEVQRQLQTKQRADLRKEYDEALLRQREQFDKAVRELEATWKDYTLKMQQTFDAQFNFKTHEAMAMREEYNTIATFLESSVALLQSNLTSHVSGRTTERRTAFLDNYQELRKWLALRKDRVRAESFEDKSQALKDRILAGTSPVGELSTPTLQSTLGSLLNEIEMAASNYLAEAESARDLSTRNRQLAEKAVERANKQAELLLALARQAALDSRVLTVFIQSQPLPALGTMPRFDSAAQLPPPQLPEASTNAPAPTSASVSLTRTIGYPLWGAIFGLCIALGIALYRQLVVTPLRTQVAERKREDTLLHFGRLTRELAHEIRNPLTAVNARLYTLQKFLPKPSSQLADVEVIQNEIRRLNRIVEEFLRLGSPAEPRLEQLKPRQALEEIFDLLRPEMERRSITFLLECSTESHFRADPGQLKQVLINLVNNAADSIADQGSIILRARQNGATLKGTRTEAVILEVEDTGSGIPPELQSRLFEPFFSTKDKGTGLGLPIAAGIIDKHGGKLDFETELGKGTVFRVILPAIKPDSGHG